MKTIYTSKKLIINIEENNYEPYRIYIQPVNNFPIDIIVKK